MQRILVNLGRTDKGTNQRLISLIRVLRQPSEMLVRYSVLTCRDLKQNPGPSSIGCFLGLMPESFSDCSGQLVPRIQLNSLSKAAEPTFASGQIIEKQERFQSLTRTLGRTEAIDDAARQHLGHRRDAGEGEVQILA